MSNKNAKLGGTNWADGNILYAADLNDTLDALGDHASDSYFVGFEILSVSVTSTTASATYATKKRKHIIKNAGDAICYVSPDAAATTSKFEVLPGETIVFHGIVAAWHAISNTGETTTLRVFGVGDTTSSANSEALNLSVSNVSASVATTSGTRVLLIKNVGATTCYINLNGAASTSHFPLEGHETISLNLTSTTAVHAITSSETTTLKILASRT